MRIGFDHCYQVTRSVDDYLALGARGFTLGDHVVEHPGAQRSRFLRFAPPAQPAGGAGSQYLEFIEVAGEDAGVASPGFSLSCDHDLARLHAEVADEMEVFGPHLSHRSYRWNTGEPDGPGWNFLEFEQRLVRRIQVWCTAYEPGAGRPAALAVPAHPNTVDRVHGVAWAVPAAKLEAVACLARGACRDGVLELHDGHRIYAAEALAAGGLVSDARAHPFAAVILTCRDWPTFLARARPDEVLAWQGREAAVIRTGPAGWDLVVIAA